MPFSGDKLRQLRTAAGLSREELAERAGTTKQYVSHLENGVKSNPAFDLVERLGNVLGVTCGEFLSAAAVTSTDRGSEPEPDERPRGKRK